MPEQHGRLHGCLILALLTAGCAAQSPLSLRHDELSVYVIERGWHTDIGLPVQEIAEPLSTLEQSFPGARFLTIGFGERQFLVNRRTTIAGMLSALLPSRSALLVTGLRSTPEEAFGQRNVVLLRVTRGGLARINAAIWQELEVPATGQPTVLAAGPYAGSVFYAARDTYDGLFTCNTWTAKMLRSADLPVQVLGVLFSGQVMGMARWIAMQQTRVPEN